MEKEKIKKIITDAIVNGGFTKDSTGKDSTTKKGYIVSDYGKEKTYLVDDKNDMIQLEKDIVKYFESIEKQKNVFVGGWLEDGIFYLDISRIYTSKKEATRTAKKNRQIAIYDIQKNKSIYLTRTFYSVHNVKKDFQNIADFESIEDIKKAYNIKNPYHYTVKSIEDVTEKTHLLNDKYIIIKNEE